MAATAQSAIAVIGIDIGKNSFHVVGLDGRGAIVVLRQKWSGGQVETRFANMSACLIGMEACVGAHHLSRNVELEDLACPEILAGGIRTRGPPGIVFDDPLVGEPKDITVARGRRICRLPLSDAGVEAPTVANAAEVFRTTRSIRRDATAARRRKSACVARCSRSASRSSSRIRSKRSRARRRKRRVQRNRIW